MRAPQGLLRPQALMLKPEKSYGVLLTCIKLWPNCIWVSTVHDCVLIHVKLIDKGLGQSVFCQPMKAIL